MKNLITFLIFLLSTSIISLSQINEFKLLPGDGASNDYFGWSASLKGNYSIVGAPFNDDSAGAAYIFRLDGSIWIEEQKLVASDGLSGDWFGYYVDLSNNYAVIGAPNNDSTGAVYVFKREGSDWIEQQKLSVIGFGRFFTNYLVSISGDYIVIGTPFSDSSRGSAHIFGRDGNNWIELQKLSPSDSITTIFFGSSVSIFKDRAIVGAAFGNFWTGSAYIFKREGTTWIEEQKITASDGVGLNYFGIAVSMFGEYVIVGAMGSQSAYIFKNENASWSEEQKLIASDGSSGKDYFGASVSIWEDYLVIGAPGDDSSSGSAYIFNYSGSNWVERIKLTAPDRIKNDIFGVSVSISGNNTIIGVARDDDNGENSGSAYIYNGFVVGVENEQTEIPLSFQLNQNYPNPFNPSTKIIWQVPAGSWQTLKVYDVLGKEVAILADEYKPAGTYEVEWDATNHPSGVYFYQLKATSFIETNKMILLK